MTLEKLSRVEKDLARGYLSNTTRTEFLKTISLALRDYTKDGASLEDFEEEYQCKIIFDDDFGGIKDVTFDGDIGKTALYLRYIK